jgi:probable poly-beta-1,6-N-acetyl-D-glucosamine export protein
MKISEQHKDAIDVLRIVAIFAVVLIHTSTKTLGAAGNDLLQLPFTMVLNQVSRFAVPLFFLISGFVLEYNYHPNEGYFQYIKRRLNKIFVPYIFWSVIYYFFVYYRYRDPNFVNVLVRGEASYQLYFIPALLIFYLVFPLAHKCARWLCNKWVMLLLFIVEAIILYNNYNVQLLKLKDPLRTAVLNFFPFVTGIFVSRNYAGVIRAINKYKWWFLIGTSVFAWIVFYQGFDGYLVTGNYLKYYSQWRASVLVYTLLLGGLMFWIFNRKLAYLAIVKLLSKLSFFVFFFHVIVLEIVWNTVGAKYFQIQFAQNTWWDCVFFATVATVSFVTGYAAHRIPYLSRLTG